MTNPWIVIIPAVIGVGALCGACVRPERAVILGAAIPWLAMLIFLVSQASSPGGGLWIIGQLFSGTAVALLGGLTAHIIRRRRTDAAEKKGLAQPGRGP